MVILWMLRWVLILVAAATEQCFSNGGDDLQLLQERRKDPTGPTLLSRLPTARVAQVSASEVQVDFFPLEVPEGRVGKDMGNATRRHFFIIGPEGSSTRFWSMQLADGINLTNSKELRYMKNNLINNQASLSHISLPFGNTCKHKVLEEPILLDFGGRPEAYEYTGQETIKMKTMMGMGFPIFFVDPLEVIKAHHQRNDAVTMLLVVRDPRASLENKIRHHCKSRSTGRKENKKAFELILKAARAAKEMEKYQQDIHMVCYEDIVKKGAPYIKEKLRSMGITPSEEDARFFDGNKKYPLEGHDCESDSLAYAELCPDTDFSRQVKASCTDAFPTSQV